MKTCKSCGRVRFFSINFIRVRFEMFVHEVNIQDKYNKVNGPILAVPIVAYHMIDNTKAPYSTDVILFDREMKYLHDNVFNVLPVNDLGYDTKNNFLYIKPSVAQLTAANPVNLTKFNSIKVTHVNGIVPKQSSAITLYCSDPSFIEQFITLISSNATS